MVKKKKKSLPLHSTGCALWNPAQMQCLLISLYLNGNEELPI